MFKIPSINFEKYEGEKEILSLKTTKYVYLMSHRRKYGIPHSDIRNTPTPQKKQYKVYKPFITAKHCTK